MECPKCGNSMKTVRFQTFAVEQCSKCGGLWFDMLEAEHLKKLHGSASIDTGDVETGKLQNKIENINCPVCSTKMIKMVVNNQPHIWYESCPTCFGTYFDAGEFTDFTKQTLIDIVKDILAKERK